MADINELLNYFKKLQRVINFDATFSLFGRTFIRKNKIDDLLCCILATLPESYKKMMRSDQSKNLKSIVCYSNLFKTIKQKCIFSSNVYQVNVENANKLIVSILATLEQDINYVEKNL